MNANDLRPGMIIRHNGELFTIYKAEHRTPGNLRAFVQAKMRNLRTGAMNDHRFRSEDNVEKAAIDDVEMQYLYADGDSYYFMNTANYEQIRLTKEAVGDRAAYMIPEVMLKVAFFEGPDEPAHWHFACYLNQNRALPFDDLSCPEAFQPPLYYLLIAPLGVDPALPAIGYVRPEYGTRFILFPPRIYQNASGDLGR